MATKIIETLKQIILRKKDLMVEERELRKTMPEHVNQVTKMKPLKLFRELLEQTAFQDMNVSYRSQEWRTSHVCSKRKSNRQL